MFLHKTNKNKSKSIGGSNIFIDLAKSY